MNGNNRTISVLATPVNTNGSNSPISGVEQVLIDGDLSKLSQKDRLNYYQRVCESLGLNPLTKPFDYLKNKKAGTLTLYANKDCAAQLRRIYGVSIAKCDTEIKDGIFIVTVVATNAAGQADCDIGCVPIKNLQGEEMANAMMRAVTKAKRRATLSLCGLGWLDQSEVEAIAEVVPVPVEKTSTLPPPTIYNPSLAASQRPHPEFQPPEQDATVRSAIEAAIKNLALKPQQVQIALMTNYQKDQLDTLTNYELTQFVQYLDFYAISSQKLKTVGWTPAQGQEFLKENCSGKKNRVELTLDELIDFVTFLQESN